VPKAELHDFFLSASEAEPNSFSDTSHFSHQTVNFSDQLLFATGFNEGRVVGESTKHAI
jgi:hypothetical protein